MTDQDALEIRLLTYEDLPAVAAIERRSFPTPWSIAMFVLELSKPSSLCLAALLDGRLTGYTICSRYDTAETRVHLLRGDHVGGDRSVTPDERGARVVAARLEREDHGRWWATGSASGTSSRRPRSVAGVRHMISASSPLSW